MFLIIFIFIILSFILILINYFFAYCQKEKISLSKIYLINLEQSKERLQNAKNLLNMSKIAFERFDASYGIEIEIEDEFGNKFTGRDLQEKKAEFQERKTYFINCDEGLKIKYIPNYSSNKLYKNVMKRALLPGEIGCLCSHLRIFKEIIEKKLGYVLIFEDDIVFNKKKDFNKELSDILNNFPIDCDIYYLSSNQVNFKFFVWFKFLKRFLPKINYVFKHRPFAMMSAYIVKQEVAKKIINHVEKFGIENLPIDDFITRFLMKQYNLNLYVNGKNDLILHGNFQSEIDNQVKRFK